MKERKNFWRKYAYYIIIGVCALAIIGMSTYAIIKLNGDSDKGQIIDGGDDSGDNGGDTPVPVDTKIIFAMPVSNVNVIKESTDETTPVSYNTTMGYYTAHVAVDFGGTAGDSVFAVYGGTIESVTTDTLNGTKIIINHGNGLKTVYRSLTEAGTLKAGDTVKKGDLIGTMSSSYGYEYSEGAHLHFEVIENGKAVNPSKYLVFEEK